MKKIGRNDPCPCGSGKKYKKCCLNKDQIKFLEESRPFEDYFVDLPPVWGSKRSKSSETVDYRYESRPRPKKEKYNSYESLRKKLPKISREQEKIIDDWWDGVMPYYEKLETSEMMDRVITFMEEYPALFVHLDLHEEFLFELGAEFAREKRLTDYIDLLVRIRKEHPEMYKLSFGYYDYQILVYLVSSNQREQIPKYFSFFKQYPVVDPENTLGVINLLAWSGLDKELFAFLDMVALNLWQAAHIVSSGDEIFWKMFKEYMSFLDSSESAVQKAPELMKKIKSSGIPMWSGWNEAYFCRELTSRRKTPKDWDISICRTEKDVHLFYHDLAWNYAGFLHDHKRMNWVKSRFLADRLEDYWTDIPPGKRPKEPFRLISRHMDKFISENFKAIIYIDGVLAASFLQAVWFFADYLLHFGWRDGEDARDVQSHCLDLYEVCKKVIDDLDAVHWMITDFPKMVGGVG